MHRHDLHQHLQYPYINVHYRQGNFYIFRKLADYDVKLSVIARGISVGDELEYTDEVTLGRSIVNRTPFIGKSF